MLDSNQVQYDLVTTSSVSAECTLPEMYSVFDMLQVVNKGEAMSAMSEPSHF